MAKALYRKYRSRKLSEVVGQDHITSTLQNALDKGQISHAYLLTGPRGVGKTSVARILAHEVNELPFDEDDFHLDIIEIDAASNRRIDEIRDLREKANLAPTSAKYKVYIIDEVHMLTREAFNALLKTLEEPPAHVIFILATTELHKLPETIISRTQRFGFRPISSNDLTSHLKTIAKKEKIEIDDDALMLIAEHAGGSFRDAIGLLDQARGLGKKITGSDIELLLGRASAAVIYKVLELTLEGNVYQSLEELHQLLDQGYSAEILSEQLIVEARKILMSGESNQSRKLIELCRSLLKISQSLNPNVALELTILETSQQEVIHSEKVSHTPLKETKQEAKELVTDTKEKVKVVKGSSKKFDEIWKDFLDHLKGQHNTLYGILRMAEIKQTSDNKITLYFQFPFHMKRAAEPKHRSIIDKVMQEVGGKDYAIEFAKSSIKPQSKKAEGVKEKKEASAVQTVKDVFGDAEEL